MNRITLLIGFVLANFLLAACGKDPLRNLTDEESRVFITNHDRSANFRSFATFSIADSVRVIDGNRSGVQLNATDRAFINALAAQMEARGYQRVAPNAAPHLGLQATRIIQTSTGLVSFPDVWGFWDPFFWGVPGAGWGGPPVWGVASYQIREGLLSIDMFDLMNAQATGSINVIWNGIIRGNGIFNANTADAQVRQLFEQSPYLSAN